MKSSIRTLILVALFCAHSTAIAAYSVLTDESTFFAALGASVTTLDFSADENGAPIANATVLDQHFASLGLDFENFADGKPFVWEVDTPKMFPEPAVGGPLLLPIRKQASTAPGGGFKVLFPANTRAFGLWIGDLQDESFGTTTFVARDASATPIVSVNLFQALGDGTFTWLFFGIIGSLADPGIASIEIDVGNSDSLLFDNLSFAEVPLPAAGLLMAPGIALMMRLVRSRRHLSV